MVKAMGDGLLLEFPSVVDATRCAIEVQEGMAARNADVADDRRVSFRVGINLCDIIIDGDDILDDGVNIAARLQEIAEPGGVCLSRRVHEDAQDRLASTFEDAAEKPSKNFPCGASLALDADGDSKSARTANDMLSGKGAPSILFSI